jgi:hypothetical protein
VRRRSPPPIALVALAFVAPAAAAARVQAADEDPSHSATSDEAPARAATSDQAPSYAPTMRRGGWVDLVGTAFVGDGIRFNNPYRLATILGSNAESLSRTATYADVGVTLMLGDPDAIAHGLALRISVSAEGVSQTVMTPSYVALHRWGPWGAYGRIGPSIVLTPDTTWGLEGAAGGLWFPVAGIGIAAELVGDVFYGAGTRDVQVATYPVLSGQLGLWLSWEAMP